MLVEVTERGAGDGGNTESGDDMTDENGAGLVLAIMTTDIGEGGLAAWDQRLLLVTPLLAQDMASGGSPGDDDVQSDSPYLRAMSAVAPQNIITLPIDKGSVTALTLAAFLARHRDPDGSIIVMAGDEWAHMGDEELRAAMHGLEQQEDGGLGSSLVTRTARPGAYLIAGKVETLCDRLTEIVPDHVREMMPVSEFDQSPAWPFLLQAALKQVEHLQVDEQLIQRLT